MYVVWPDKKIIALVTSPKKRYNCAINHNIQTESLLYCGDALLIYIKSVLSKMVSSGNK